MNMDVLYSPQNVQRAIFLMLQHIISHKNTKKDTRTKQNDIAMQMYKKVCIPFSMMICYTVIIVLSVSD